MAFQGRRGLNRRPWKANAVESTALEGHRTYRRELRRSWKTIVRLVAFAGTALTVLITAANGRRQPGSASAAGFSPDSHFIRAFEKHHDRTIGRVAMEDVLVEIVFAWPRVAVDDPKVLHVQTDGRVS